MNARILFVEDNRDLAFGLQHNLEYEGYEVEVQTDGPAGLAAARSTRFDLIILDLMMPGMGGFEILEVLRREENKVPVLILTARSDELDKVRGLRLGADDYVEKPFGVLELTARVEALLRRARMANAGPPSATVHEFGEIQVDESTRTVLRGGETVQLAPREFELLIALIRRAGAAASRLELLEEVWGHKAAVETRTVDTHVAELRKKLEQDSSNPVHILTVRKIGYRLQV